MLADCHRLWIDAGQLVRAEFAKERNSILGHDNSVRNSILGWCRFYLDVASARIKPADHARFLEREPQDSFLIENRCMRIFRTRIAHAVFSNLTGFRIELPDVSLEDGGEPDVSWFAAAKPSRPEARGLNRDSRDWPGFWASRPRLFAHCPGT